MGPSILKSIGTIYTISGLLHPMNKNTISSWFISFDIHIANSKLNALGNNIKKVTKLYPGMKLGYEWILFKYSIIRIGAIITNKNMWYFININQPHFLLWELGVFI